MLELELASLFMASQPPQTDLSLAEFDSFIRGFHVYKDVWTPVVAEMLLLKREPTNAVDYCAVGVYKESELVAWSCTLQYIVGDITVSAKRL